jgi:hypothetical protein
MAKPNQRNAGNEIGQSGTIILSGMLSNDDYNTTLTGERAIDAYNEMRLGDATVKAALLAVMLPIPSADWRVEPADESAQAKEIAEWVWSQLNGMTRSFHEFQREALNYLVFGRYLFEIA